MKAEPENRARGRWLKALGQPGVWRRAALIGLPLGLLQAGLNQGDIWLRHEQTAATVAKTVLSPLLTFTVALVTAAGAWRERRGADNSQNHE